MNLENKIVLITGGARMGEAIASRLAVQGADIVITYRKSREGAERVAKRVAEFGRKAYSLEADFEGEQVPLSVVNKVQTMCGGLHVLIHMSSIYESVEFKKLDIETWNRYERIHLRSAYLLALAAAPVMINQGSGKMIYVTDWTVESSRPRYKNRLPYYVTKGGIQALVESLALELAPNVAVNAVAPGPILPPQGIDNKEADEVLKNTPAGRWGGADEIAKAVHFLCDSDFVTGETIRVDGGRHLL